MISRGTRIARSVALITDDPDDNIILECAVAAGSNWTVTEDKDLLRLGAFEQIRIVRGAHFLKVAYNPKCQYLGFAEMIAILPPIRLGANHAIHLSWQGRSTFK
jgi:hypothetical protein